MNATEVAVPRFESYGDYSSGNYGVNALVFTDTQGRDFYFSYKTLVAVRTIKSGLIVHENYWGSPTGKHLNWIDGGNKAGRLPALEFEVAVREALAQ